MRQIGQEFLLQSGREAKRLKKSADHAIGQLSVANLYTSLDEDGNCVAVLMKHIAGSLRRYCRQTLKPQEKISRYHPRLEFTIEEGESMEVVRAHWEKAWESFFQALGSLCEEDVLRSTQAGEEQASLLRTLQFNQSHLAFHVGQIVFLAKHLKGCDWEPLQEGRPSNGPALVERKCC
ncbi:MAG TPA: DUF1572 family protein [Acidobacteriota bacterium]|nr:DUF1572 family protein [Acidobacteriota bacterium]